MANESNTKFATETLAAIAAHTYTPRPWDKSWDEVATLIMFANMTKARAGKSSPVAAKALARIESNLLTK